MKKGGVFIFGILLGILSGSFQAEAMSSDITLVSLVFQRTVLRPGADIPLAVRIWNNGLTDTEVTFQIKLSDNLSLKSGSLNSLATMSQLDYTEVSWTLVGPLSGNIYAELNVIVGPGDTIKGQASGVISDKYWTQKEFFLSAWSPPTDMQIAYDYYSGANFDFNLAIHNPPFTAGVNLVKANGMKCFVQIPEIIPDYWTKLTGSNTIPPELTDEDLLKMNPLIEAYKNEKSVTGYHIIDEPGANRFKNLEKLVSYLKEKDPGRLAYINVFGITAEAWQMDSRDYYDYISRYLSEVKPEMLSFDNYHFLTNSDAPHYFQNLEIIRELALKFDLPYTNIIQLIGTEPEYLPSIPFSGWRTPGPAEHRFLVYSSLAYGFTGIIWFHWQLIWGFTSYPAEKKAEIYATISQLNKEMKNIGDEMLRLKSVGTYHNNEVPAGAHKLPVGELVSGIMGSENYVVGLFKDSAQSDYFMIMNKNYNADLNTTIFLKNNLSKLEFFNADTDSWVAIDNFANTDQGSEFTMLIGAGNGILFRPVWNTVGISKLPGMNYKGFVRSYPNPFSTSSTIEYKISNDEDVELSVSDILGKRVSLLENQFKKSGVYSVIFDSENLPEGIYFYTLKTKTQKQTGRMIHHK
jgi:hypothetical protein